MFWTAAGMGLPDAVDVKHPDGSINYWVVIYFASFILVLNWTLLQVLKYYIVAFNSFGRKIVRKLSSN
jgi:hypothetical protein